MALSPYYSWTEPDDTSFVKNGADAMRTLGNAADATVNQIEMAKGKIVHSFLLMGA